LKSYTIDREVSAGEKFGDSDLIGIPRRYVISEKTLAADASEGGSVEVKDRMTGNVEMVKNQSSIILSILLRHLSITPFFYLC